MSILSSFSNINHSSTACVSGFGFLGVGYRNGENYALGRVRCCGIVKEMVWDMGCGEKFMPVMPVVPILKVLNACRLAEPHNN